MPDVAPTTAGAPSAPSTPAPSGGSAPSGAAEPVAAASGAAEPVAAPAALPTPDAFAWDKWDGKDEALPDPLRPWHQKFKGYYDGQTAAERMKYQDDIAKQQAAANQWRRLYESAGTGQEDPRLVEATEKVKSYETAFERYQAETQENVKAIQSEFDAVTSHYFDLVQAQNKEFFAGMTPEVRTALEGALDHLPLHVAVEYAALGPQVLAEAVSMAQKGASPDIIARIVQAEKMAAQAGKAPRPAAPAASIVAGGSPTTPPARVPAPNDTRPTDRGSLLAQIARKAMAEDGRRGAGRTA